MAEPKKIKSKGAPKMPQPAQPPLLEGVSTKKAKQPAGNQASLANLPDSKYAPIALPRASEFKPGDIMGNDQEYVQMYPDAYSGPSTAKYRRGSTKFQPPAGGGVIRFGAQGYEFDTSGNLVRATSSALTAGVRDPANYAARSGGGLDFFHILGVDFGHRDGRIQEYGGFLGPAYLNRDTGEGLTPLWYNAEREARKIAEKLHREGKDYLIEVEAPNWQNGRPEKMRIRVWSGGKVVDPPGGAAAWVEIPKTIPNAPSKAPVPFKAPPAKGGNASKGDSANSKKPVISAAPVDKVAPSASTEKPVETPKPVEIAKPPQLPERSLSSVSTNQARANESGKSAPPMNKINFDASPGRRQVFERVGAPDMGPRNWGGPSSRGEAMGGAAQLLIEVEHMLQLQATVQDARRSGSLRTFRWWLQRGVIPPYRGITDRWFRDDDKTTDISEIIRSEGSNKLSGVEVGMLNDESQYAAFESWVKENIHTWDDLYLHFVYHLDSGVRLDLGSWKWTVKKWEWGDWWPATVSEENVEDKRISNFMDTVLSDLLGQKKTELENLSQQKEVFGRGSNARIVGKRHFRTDGFRDRSLYDPYTHIALMHYFQWQSPPLFYEVSHPSVPVGFTLVAGANLSTYLTIHDFRSHYGTVTNVNPTIGPPPIYDRDKPVMGWDSIMNLPVVLVKTDSLAAQ